MRKTNTLSTIPDLLSTKACPPNRRQLASRRKGAAAVFGLILTLSLVILMAVTIDYGQILVGGTELRRSADAAAMAACWEVFDGQYNDQTSSAIQTNAKQAANDVAYSNTVGQMSPQFSGDDVEIGTYGVDQSWSTTDPSSYNAVRVTLSRDHCDNGELPLFFGSFTGRHSQALQRTATAAMFHSISGFYEPGNSDESVGILPIALDEPSWYDVLASATDDNFAYVNGALVSGSSDGKFETNLYPKGTGSPGNRGTVDIGAANNSTTDISRQVIHGISKQDFVDLGKPLAFNAAGEIKLNGDTGISAAIKDELASLIGKTRIIPIFRSVTGNGDGSTFTIVRFEGVRILDVKLTGKGSNKRVIIQPAKVIARGAKIDYSGTYTSTHLVTPVMLVE